MKWLLGKKGDVNWTPIYLIILAAIALILLVSVVKPMFQSALQGAASGLP